MSSVGARTSGHAAIPGSGVAFAVVTTLFFAWGFVTSNNDPLIAALRGIYRLTFAEALLTQFVFFAAYAIISLPAAAILASLGASRTIIAALCLMIAACFLVPLSSAMESYPVVLAALFLLAAGVTVLQVAANPLAAALGRPERSHLRLVLAQGFNSLGVVLGVHVGSSLMLSDAVFGGKADVVDAAGRRAALGAIDHAFIVIALMLGAIAVVVGVARRRLALPAEETASSPLAALKSRWAVAGAAAIFLYVGAEVALGSVMINFLNQPGIWNVSLSDAGWYTGWIYWFGALFGRFIGSALLIRIRADRLLLAAALPAMGLCLTAAMAVGPIAAWATLAVGLFNSIMFPTIFTLTLERSSAPVPATSGLLCVAIVGGALIPLLVGHIADIARIGVALLVPCACYALIAVFAATIGRNPSRAVPT